MADNAALLRVTKMIVDRANSMIAESGRGDMHDSTLGSKPEYVCTLDGDKTISFYKDEAERANLCFSLLTDLLKGKTFRLNMPEAGPEIEFIPNAPVTK